MITLRKTIFLLVCVFFLFLAGCGKNKNGTESTLNDSSGNTNVKKTPVESTEADSTENISPSKDPIDFNNLPEGIKVVFVEIGSVKCIPCKMMQPVMNAVNENYGEQVKVVFYDVWTPEGRPYGQKYNIRVIPTQIFMDRSGKEISRHEGFYPKKELVKLLKQNGVQ